MSRPPILHRALCLATSISLFSQAIAQVTAPPWPHEQGDVEPDPNVHWGTLANGFRYAILPNQEPPERVSLRLLVDAGSLMESDEQQGLAHFLEHMAFNGTTNFPAGEMVEYFQRLGMAFGADTNAHTSFHETVYKLELPSADPELLETSMLLFADYAERMLLLDQEIEDERGIILSEKLSRDSASYRKMLASFSFSLPDSLIPSRLPIGTEEVIKDAGRDLFVDFYERYYSPDRLTLVAVGAISPEALLPLVERHFAVLEPADERAPDPDLGEVTTGRGTIAHLHTDPELPRAEISLTSILPLDPSADSSARRARSLTRSIADLMLARRFELLAEDAKAPFISASPYSYDFLDFARISGIEVAALPEKWGQALAVAEQELRRVLLFGFTQAEFAEAAANVRNAAKQAASQASTRQSRGLADSLVSQISSKETFTHPDQDLAFTEAVLDSINPELCVELFREDWQGEDRNIFVSRPSSIDGETSAILAAWADAQKVDVTAPEEVEVAEFAYTHFGEPGSHAEPSVHEDLGLTQLIFDNGIRVNLMPTDFQKGVIRMAARVGSGKLTEPADAPGLAAFASSTFERAGLAAHSADELQRILAGRTVGISFSVDDDAFLFAGRTSPEDLTLQLQLLAAYLSAPGYRQEAELQFRRNIEAIYKQATHTPEGLMQDQVSRFLYGGDQRFGLPPQEELAARSLEEVRDWLKAPLSSSYLELTLVGDIEVEAAKEAISQTLGALPARETEKPALEEARKVAFPAPTSKTFTYQSEIPRAIIALYWPTDDMWDIAKTRRLGLLSSILGDRLRLKIREELGDAYSPVAYRTASQVYDGYGYMVALVTLAPEQAAGVVDVIAEIAADIVEEGISQDEFERALTPTLTQLRQMRRDNGYWLSTVLSSSQEFPQQLDWAREILDDYAAIKPAELEALAQLYLKADSKVVVTILPEQLAAE
jgi:zinc protease